MQPCSLTTPVIPATPAAGAPRLGLRFMATTTVPPSHTEKRRSALSSHSRQFMRLPLWDLWWNPAPLDHPVPATPLPLVGGGGAWCRFRFAIQNGTQIACTAGGRWV